MLALIPTSTALIAFAAKVILVRHEFGHDVAAWSLGVEANRVAMGFGPVIARIVDRRGVERRFGYCR